MAHERGSEFYLRLNGLTLPAKVEQTIANELRATLMRELGKLDLGDFNRSADSLGVRIPKDWLGIWIDKLKIAKQPGLSTIPDSLNSLTNT